MEGLRASYDTSSRLQAAVTILTDYYRRLDEIPEDMSLEDGEVAAGEYLQSHMLSGQFTDSEIAMAHRAVARENWGETGYSRRVARECAEEDVSQ